VVQPMCLLTLLLMLITNLIYLCVSRWNACQHLPLLWLFYLHDCDCYTPSFHTLSVKLSSSLSLRFQITNMSKNKKPDLFEIGFKFLCKSLLKCLWYFCTYLSRSHCCVSYRNNILQKFSSFSLFKKFLQYGETKL
jgi:hypothetical protein